MTDVTSILVIGGAGYIGAHCYKAFAEAGYVPVWFDNLSQTIAGLSAAEVLYKQPVVRYIFFMQLLSATV